MIDLVERVQGILARPRDEWEKIREESISTSLLFTSYAAILVLIPALAQFISFGFTGIKVPLRGWITYGMGMAFFRSILFYACTLASVYVFGLIINVLAPNFSSTQDRLTSMKLAVYSMTPFMVGGVFFIVYHLWGVVIIAGMYGIYIFYLGITAPLLDTPKDKAMPYLLVSVGVAVVLAAAVWNLLKLIFAAWTIYRSI